MYMPFVSLVTYDYTHEVMRPVPNVDPMNPGLADKADLHRLPGNEYHRDAMTETSRLAAERKM